MKRKKHCWHQSYIQLLLHSKLATTAFLLSTLVTRVIRRIIIIAIGTIIVGIVVVIVIVVVMPLHLSSAFFHQIYVMIHMVIIKPRISHKSLTLQLEVNLLVFCFLQFVEELLHFIVISSNLSIARYLVLLRAIYFILSEEECGLAWEDTNDRNCFKNLPALSASSYHLFQRNMIYHML